MLITGEMEGNDPPPQKKRFLLSIQLRAQIMPIHVYASDLALNPGSLPPFVIVGILQKPSDSLNDFFGKMGE